MLLRQTASTLPSQSAAINIPKSPMQKNTMISNILVSVLKRELLDKESMSPMMSKTVNTRLGVIHAEPLWFVFGGRMFFASLTNRVLPFEALSNPLNK